MLSLIANNKINSASRNIFQGLNKLVEVRLKGNECIDDNFGQSKLATLSQEIAKECEFISNDIQITMTICESTEKRKDLKELIEAQKLNITMLESFITRTVQENEDLRSEIASLNEQKTSENGYQIAPESLIAVKDSCEKFYADGSNENQNNFEENRQLKDELWEKNSEIKEQQEEVLKLRTAYAICVRRLSENCPE